MDGMTQMKPKGHVPSWIGITLLLLIAVGAGGGVAWYLNKNVGLAVGNLQTQVDTLGDQVNEINKKLAEQNSKPKDDSTPDSVTFDEKKFNMVAVAGWKKKDAVIISGTEIHKYENSTTGEYFEVEIDAPRDYCGEDFVWKISPNSNKDGYVVVDEGKQAEGKVELCNATPKGDGKYAVIAFDHSNNKIKNKAFVFTFGNVKKESGADRQVFRDILKSFKAK